MSKVKSVSQFNGLVWGEAVPLGVDADNIDITSTTTAPADTTATLASLDTADVTVLSTNNDTGASAWTKFNIFRKRVANNFANYIAGSISNAYETYGYSNRVYSTTVINSYMNNVIGYAGTTASSDGTVAAQLQNLRNGLQDATTIKTGRTQVGTTAYSGVITRSNVYIKNSVLYCSFIYTFGNTASASYSSTSVSILNVLHPTGADWRMGLLDVDNPFDIPLYCRRVNQTAITTELGQLKSSSANPNIIAILFSQTQSCGNSVNGDIREARGTFAVPVKITPVT